MYQGDRKYNPGTVVVVADSYVQRLIRYWNSGKQFCNEDRILLNYCGTIFFIVMAIVRLMVRKSVFVLQSNLAWIQKTLRQKTQCENP